MRIRWSRNILIFIAISILLTCMLVGGVYATWHYRLDVSSEHQYRLPCQLYLWNEIPKGDEGVIIEKTGTQVADSLNNPSSELNYSISSKQFFGMNAISSVDNLHGDQLRQEMGLDPNANFLVEFPDANTRIVYTTTADIGGSSTYYGTTFDIPIGEYIYPVYRTVVIMDTATSSWVQQATHRGYASSSEYVTFITTAPFFDPATWTRGKLGTSLTNAIYAYKGQSVKALLDDKGSHIYYKVVSDTAGAQYTVSVTAPNDAVVSVLDDSGKPLAVSSNGSQSVVFNSALEGTTYYIDISGAETVEFNIA